MFRNICKILFLSAFFTLSAVCCFAQNDNGRNIPNKEDLPKNIQESLEKKRIEQEKKDHEELLKRAEEAIKLSNELQDSYDKNKNLSADDKKKLEKLEKLLKKIRKDLGGDDDNGEKSDNDTDSTKEDKPSTIFGALKKLTSDSVSLLDELKKTSRFSISVVAIQSSNTILKVIRFLRFGN
ncbi:MAG TPA: hypothetical protein PKY59_16510 [Pyrinomonadaceae bacterium]|nr:hypothetical protein [Pyrinomonadaceae bacterium]